MRKRDSVIHWGAIARRHPSAFLLLAQLVSLLLYAVLEQNLNGRAVLASFGVLVLIMVVWVIRRSPSIRWVSWLLGAPVFVLSPLALLYPQPGLQIVAAVMEALLYFYTSGSLIAYMMGDDRVTIDELFAAGATFTLIAWGFAYAYLALETWMPGSFLADAAGDPPLVFLEHLTLSFNNLSAVGLGDIIPVTALARVLVMLEQFAGVAYIAVVVSRLIGLTIIRSRQR